MHPTARVFLFTVSLLLTQSVSAELRLPSLFTEHGVLQQKMPLAIWGWAAPGSRVQIRLTGLAAWRDDQAPLPESLETAATADADGRFDATLPSVPGPGRGQLVVSSGEETLTVDDLLIGEVWFCSGQSNMTWPLQRAADPQTHLAAANRPHLRLFHGPLRHAPSPQDDVDSAWAVCTPDTATGFSAVAYHFGVALQEAMQVPVGLIHSSWGGTPAEAWTSWESLEKHPVTRPIITRTRARLSDPPPQTPMQREAAQLYHAMVLPYAGYGIKGVIWYQGEGNARRAYQYRTLLPMMIRDWKRAWNQPTGHHDLAFGIVELASYKKPQTQPADDAWAELREAQRMTAANTPNAGSICTLDIGDAHDIHPDDKQTVGRRLANWALATQYGQTDRIHAGPEIIESSFGSGHALVTVRSNGTSRFIDWPENIRGFALAGEDRQWHWAQAHALKDGLTLKLTSNNVPRPVAVRYAWQINPYDGPNGARITNDAGLPMAPYRSDDWPGLTHRAR